MGFAFTGIADDASALFINPAGLGLLNQGQVFLNNDFWLVGTFQETALVGFPTADIGGFGLAAHYLDYGQMDGRDELGSVTTSYSADQWGLQAGWGFKLLKNFSIGFGVHGVQTVLAGVGYTAFTSNVGILLKEKGWGLGASYVNTGWVSPGGASEDAVNVGASYETALDSSNHLLTVVGGSIEPNAVSYLQAGLEYSLQRQLFLRVGCQTPLSNNDLGGLTDLTAGVGFRFSGVSLDYAYLPYGDLGTAQRVSVGYFFGDGPSQASTLAKNNKRPQASPGHPAPSGGIAASGLNPGGHPLNSMGGATFSNQVPPPLPPGNVSSPSVQAPASTSSTHSTASGPQLQTANPSDAKDSLVVQFDLPDNPAPSGVELEKQGKIQEALQAYIEAVKQYPGDVASWWAMGNLYRQMNQKAYAIQCFGQVLKLQPDNPKLADWLEQYKASNP